MTELGFRGAWVLGLVALAGCGPGIALIAEGEADDPVEVEGALVADGTPAARAVLLAVNEAPLTVFPRVKGLSSRARNVLRSAKAGADGLPGTTDDRVFTAVAQLLTLEGFGPGALNALGTWAAASGLLAPQWTPTGYVLHSQFAGIPSSPGT